MAGREGDEKSNLLEKCMGVQIDYGILLEDSTPTTSGAIPVFQINPCGCISNTEFKGRTKSQVNKCKILMAD